MLNSKRIAVFGALLMLVAAVAPTMAAAAPSQGTAADSIDGDSTFASLPDNETDDNDTDSDVNETEESDENETDENDTDSDVNETNETDVNETEDADENETNETDGNASSTADAAALFTSQLQLVIENSTNNSSVQAPGLAIAEFVVANNPGNAPDHAGPPANATNGSQGPPANASDGGPPNGTDADGNETDGGPGSNGNGPKVVSPVADGFERIGFDATHVSIVAPFEFAL